MNGSALEGSEVVRTAVLNRLLAGAERVILDDDWDGAMERLLSVLEIEPRHPMAKASLDHLTSLAPARAAG